MYGLSVGVEIVNEGIGVGLGSGTANNRVAREVGVLLLLLLVWRRQRRRSRRRRRWRGVRGIALTRWCQSGGPLYKLAVSLPLEQGSESGRKLVI